MRSVVEVLSRALYSSVQGFECMADTVIGLEAALRWTVSCLRERR